MKRLSNDFVGLQYAGQGCGHEDHRRRIGRVRDERLRRAYAGQDTPYYFRQRDVGPIPRINGGNLPFRYDGRWCPV